MDISVSILGSKDRIKDTKILNNTSCDYIHIDVMDGKFVPNKQFSINEIIDIIKVSNKKIDIHLMVEDPLYYINLLKEYNINNITFHYEIKENLYEIISVLKQNNIKVGLAIKPNTKITSIIKYIDLIDLVLIMSVEPGYGGQEFIPNTLSKIKELKELLTKYNKNIIIEVDGGVNNKNSVQLKKEQTDIAVVGSYITNSNNFEEKIQELK